MNQSPMRLNHRLDIEGLRGLAVLLVVLFHLDVPWLSGGFIGVDIFFVISGFVVTRKIWSQLEVNQFRLRDFYANRFWRLSPSFLLVALATLVVSYFVLSPAALSRAAQSAAAAAGMSANFFFWLTTSGYESEAAEEAPFLQMWSLAVEEQFYLLWPCLLLVVVRARKTLKSSLIWQLGLVFGLLLALGGSEWLARTAPSAAFYLLPARAFELGLGAACVVGERLVTQSSMRPSPWLLNVGLGVGASLCVGSSFVLTNQSIFPGLHAFVPCLGTALVIQVGSYASCNASGEKLALSRVFSWRPLCALGRVSYAWYLWHWPGIALLHYTATPLTASTCLALFAGSLALAGLSTRYFEGPTRRNPTRGWKIVVLAVALSLVGSVAAILVRGDSSPDLGPVDEEAALDYRDLSCLFAAKTLGELDACGKVKAHGERRVLIWGDSHAKPYRNLIQRESKRWGWTPTTITSPGCPPLFGVTRKDPSEISHLCQGQIAQQVDQLLRRFEFDALLIVSRVDLYETGWIRKGRLSKSTHFLSDEGREATTAAISSDVFHEHLPQTLRTLADLHDLPIIYALPTPVMPREPREDKKRKMKVRRRDYEKMRARIDKTRLKFPRQVIVIDPIEAVCGVKSCPGWKGKEALYSDTNHLSARGMSRLARLTRAALDQATAK